MNLAPESAAVGTLSPFWDEMVRRWEPLILEKASHYGIDPDLVAAVMMVESGGDPNAVSRSGAIGLMQVMPYDAERFPSRPAAEDLFDPAFNIEWGVRILAEEIAWAGGDVSKGLMAYYGGRAQAEAGLPRVRLYAARVMALYEAAVAVRTQREPHAP